MKRLAKSFIVLILGWQVRRLTKKNNFKIVALAGSIGKTSTKFAVVHILKQQFKVQSQEGNYNDIVSVPLVFFGQGLPSIFNPLAWLLVFFKNERLISRKYPYEVIVVELGTDAPGQIEQFKRYVHPDVAVLTAITPEHMEFFEDMEAVAREETALASFSNKLIVNIDLCQSSYLANLASVPTTYGIKKQADLRVMNIKFSDDSSSFDIVSGDKIILHAEHEAITEPQLYSIGGAIAVAFELGMDESSIRSGIKHIKPVSGRMQRLPGINHSLIIDDTYNASPEATRAALDSLYRMQAPQKIAILGNMNELGNYSEAEHRTIGKYCDPSQLDLVVTIGTDANKYIAAEAEAKGCEVKSFSSPYEAGEYLKTVIKTKAIILAKGSQNKVFAEEAIKCFLADPKDASKLVRQSSAWLKIKQKAFTR